MYCIQYCRYEQMKKMPFFVISFIRKDDKTIRKSMPTQDSDTSKSFPPIFKRQQHATAPLHTHAHIWCVWTYKTGHTECCPPPPLPPFFREWRGGRCEGGTRCGFKMAWVLCGTRYIQYRKKALYRGKWLKMVGRWGGGGGAGGGGGGRRG